jgi:hypothetical protein
MRVLRILILINAVATLAAGVVLFLFPAAIPATVGIDLAPDQRFIAWLLGAAEIGIAALCISSLSGWASEPSEDRSNRAQTNHGWASRPEGARDRAQIDSSPHPRVLRAVAITLIVFHAASGIADIMALAQHITPVVAANLALRVIMVVLFAVFGLRRTN